MQDQVESANSIQDPPPIKGREMLRGTCFQCGSEVCVPFRHRRAPGRVDPQLTAEQLERMRLDLVRLAGWARGEFGQERPDAIVHHIIEGAARATPKSSAQTR
jgi:hypothetical protein